MKKKIVLGLIVLVLLLAIVVWWDKTKNNGSKNNPLFIDTEEVKEEVDNDKNTEYEVEDDVIQSITDESVDNEDSTVSKTPNQPTDDSQKKPTDDSQNQPTDEITSEEQEPDTEEPFNLDKDGDGFVDGWY